MEVSPYKILFYFKTLLWESIILSLPPSHLQSLPYCNTIARPLRNIRPTPATLLLYAIHHTLLVMAISCEGQDGAEFEDSGPPVQQQQNTDAVSSELTSS